MPSGNGALTTTAQSADPGTTPVESSRLGSRYVDETCSLLSRCFSCHRVLPDASGNPDAAPLSGTLVLPGISGHQPGDVRHHRRKPMGLPVSAALLRTRPLSRLDLF